MSHPHVHRPKVGASSAPRQLRWWPLVAVTSVNYAWQVPYAVHQYGRRWDALTGLSIPLILTGVWFAIAMVATVRGLRGPGYLREPAAVVSVFRRVGPDRRRPCDGNRLGEDQGRPGAARGARPRQQVCDAITADPRFCGARRVNVDADG